MANMSSIPGTPDWIKSKGGSGSSNIQSDTQAQDTEKSIRETANEDNKYNFGGEKGKAE